MRLIVLQATSVQQAAGGRGPRPGRRRGVAARDASQHRFVAQAAEPARHAPTRHDPLEPPRVLGDRVAEPVERLARRHPHPATHEAGAGAIWK